MVAPCEMDSGVLDKIVCARSRAAFEDGVGLEMCLGLAWMGTSITRGLWVLGALSGLGSGGGGGRLVWRVRKPLDGSWAL